MKKNQRSKISCQCPFNKCYYLPTVDRYNKTMLVVLWSLEEAVIRSRKADNRRKTHPSRWVFNSRHQSYSSHLFLIYIPSGNLLEFCTIYVNATQKNCMCFYILVYFTVYRPIMDQKITDDGSCVLMLGSKNYPRVEAEGFFPSLGCKKCPLSVGKFFLPCLWDYLNSDGFFTVHK